MYIVNRAMEMERCYHVSLDNKAGLSADYNLGKIEYLMWSINFYRKKETL